MFKSNRETKFLSDVTRELLKRCKTINRNTSSHHFNCNGLAEHFNGMLCDRLSTYLDVQRCNWDPVLPFVTLAYRASRQDTTTISSFILLHAKA